MQDGKLKAVVDFVPADVPIAGPMAEMAFQMSLRGFLAATSVGFLPTEYVVNGERTDRQVVVSRSGLYQAIADGVFPVQHPGKPGLLN